MDDYTEHLYNLGLSPKTIGIYTRELGKAMDWARRHEVDLRNLRPSDARAMADLWPNTPSVRAHLRSALTHYWDLVEVVGPTRAIKVPTPPRGRWRGLEHDQVVQLLKVAKPDWPRGGVVYVGIYLGLRREEIATLRWRQFDQNVQWVTIVGKGDRTRELPVHPRLKEKLLAHKYPGEYVFPGKMGGHITGTTVANWVQQLGELAGLGHVHPHQLRHTAGGQVNDATEDIHVAQAFLGHARVETTQTYTRVRSDRLQRAMMTLDWEDEFDEVA